MPLDPQASDFLEKVAAIRTKEYDQMPVEEARAAFQKLKAFAGTLELVSKVYDQELEDGIPVRVYEPDGAVGVLVYFHGGGWVLGSRDTCDGHLRKLANAAGCAIVSVDYRLAPEHKFPIPLEDSFSATRSVWHIREQLGGSNAKVAVGGDSAGGNLAAAVCVLARDLGEMELAFQLLIYPVTNYAFDTPSYKENAEGKLLTERSMRFYWKQYLSTPDDGENPLASVLLAKDVSRLPPGLVLTAEFDPLRDEGEAYAEKLRKAGVDMRVKRYDGLVHGFFQLGGVIDRGQSAVVETGMVLRQALKGLSSLLPRSISPIDRRFGRD